MVSKIYIFCVRTSVNECERSTFPQKAIAPTCHPKGHNLPHSQLTSACVLQNLAQSALPYPRTHSYGAVQSNAPTREPPHTQSWFAAASLLASENTNLPCVRMNPNGSLTRVPAPNQEKLQHD